VIGRELGLDFVIEGAVHRSADRVRVTVKLVDVKTDRLIWADNYELALTDIFKVQRDIVHAVVRQLRIRVPRQHRVQLQGARRSVRPAAYEAFLKGTYAWHQFSPEGFQTSVVFFKQAMDLDPDYAAAYAWFANALHVMALHGIVDPVSAVPSGAAAARQALQLDDTLAEAHAVVAAYEGVQWNWTAADHEFRRALRLKPGWAHGHHMYATLCLLVTRRFGEASTEIGRALELDPLSLPNAIQAARIRICRREYDPALHLLRESLALNPHSAELNRWLGDTYFHKGLYREAADAYVRARQLMPSIRDAWRLAQVYRVWGEHGHAVDSVLELRRLWSEKHIPPSTEALISLALGRNAEAFGWLNYAAEARDPALPFIIVLPAWDPVISDCRFEAVVKAVANGWV
jgi:serine/threonine-protein kinase